MELRGHLGRPDALHPRLPTLSYPDGLLPSWLFGVNPLLVYGPHLVYGQGQVFFGHRPPPRTAACPDCRVPHLPDVPFGLGSAMRLS